MGQGEGEGALETGTVLGKPQVCEGSMLGGFGWTGLCVVGSGTGGGGGLALPGLMWGGQRERHVCVGRV